MIFNTMGRLMCQQQEGCVEAVLPDSELLEEKRKKSARTRNESKNGGTISEELAKLPVAIGQA